MNKATRKRLGEIVGELETLRKEMVDAQDKLRTAQKDFDQKNKVFQKALAEAAKKK